MSAMRAEKRPASTPIPCLSPGRNDMVANLEWTERVLPLPARMSPRGWRTAWARTAGGLAAVLMACASESEGLASTPAHGRPVIPKPALPKPASAKPALAKDRRLRPVASVHAKPAPLKPASTQTPPAPAAPAPAAVPPAASAAPDPFRTFVEGLWPDAEARFVSRATFDAAFRGVTPDPAVLKSTGTQAEFVRPVWDYLASAITQGRIDLGRKKAAQWAPTLARIEARFGVDRFAFLGIWAMETGFGAFSGNQPVIRVLASLAFANYRGATFRDELLDALEIIQAGNVTVAAMKGSWAGAMGQTQFLPSSFKAYAVDFDGDGRCDIWSSVPDALASTAFFLKEQGWTAGLPWGFEVILPKGFDASHNEETTPAPFERWAAREVKRADGSPLPTSGEASLLIPAGLRGPAFLVTRNFRVFKSYNNATSYALAVALLGDRIAGKGPLVGAWPVRDRVLTTTEARELQTRLRDLGFDVGEIDGRIGERARDALLAYQAKAGLVADGFPTTALLEKMRPKP